MKGASELEEAGEEMDWIVSRLPPSAGHSQPSLPVFGEGAVEVRGSLRVGLLRIGSEQRVEAVLVAVVEREQHGILVQLQLLLRRAHAFREPPLQDREQPLDSFGDGMKIGAGGARALDAHAPDRLGIPIVRAERLALELDALGQERVAIVELGDGLQEGLLGWIEKGHDLHLLLHFLYSSMTFSVKG